MRDEGEIKKYTDFQIQLVNFLSRNQIFYVEKKTEEEGSFFVIAKMRTLDIVHTQCTQTDRHLK